MPQSKDALQSRRGALITLEGGEGVGKSTQLRLIVDQLRRAGFEAIATREPGGSPGAEILRQTLLSGVLKPLGSAAEALLFAAARIDHIDVTIEPALAAGVFVVSDRFSDSTRAYQGALGSLDPRFLRALERITLGSLRPDLTLVLDLPAQTGLARAARRRGPEEASDRFEGESLRFHESLRAAFLEIATAEPERCVVIDAGQPEAAVTRAIWDAISLRLLKGRVQESADSSVHGIFSQTASALGDCAEGAPVHGG
ncbi:dTMP kinase [Methylocapsa palsarum]|uniref:dTMP kinase n=1 Tax=Methylocapsa palsarum TaxID=1612308 RepID=UPI001FCDDFE8|nr:dTMP kinase [Methylocapsa palsarum]